MDITFIQALFLFSIEADDFPEMRTLDEGLKRKGRVDHGR